MNRRLASILLAGFSVSVATGTAIALGNAVSTTPPPAFVHSVEPGSSDGTDDTAGHDAEDDRRSVAGRTSPSSSTVATTAEGTTGTTGSPSKVTTSTSGPATTVTTFDDHGSDDPATHDIGGDHGGDRTNPTTSTSTPSTTVTTFDDHGLDDPATHDVGDDHGGDGGDDGGSGRHGGDG